MCADDPQIAYHAQRNLTRIGLGTVALRWTQSGFLGLPGEGRTPRNLMGFKDGTANLDASDADLMGSNVWASASDGQPWITGGSYLVSRRVRIRIEAWDRTPIGEQESIFGRRKGNGAPFGGSSEHDRVVDAKLPQDAHIRLANPRTGAASERQRILRRGYNFDDGMAPGLTQSDAGLFFSGLPARPARPVRPDPAAAGVVGPPERVHPAHVQRAVGCASGHRRRLPGRTAPHLTRQSAGSAPNCS